MSLRPSSRETHSVHSLAATGMTLLLFGCSLANMRMQVPADVANSSTMLEVSGRKGASSSFTVGPATGGRGQSFSMGPYDIKAQPASTRPTKTRKEKRGRVFKKEIEITSDGGNYAFSLNRDSRFVNGKCTWERETTEENALIGTVTETLLWRFNCECTSGGRVSESDEVDGLTVVHGDGVVTATSIEKLASGPKNVGGTFGYRFDRDGVPLGAVEVLPPGRSWLSQALKPEAQDDLACLFTGLILRGDSS